MFQKAIDIYNKKNKLFSDEDRMTLKTLAEMMEADGLTTSYQYSRKIMTAVDSGNQVRINWKILKFTAEKCELTMDELFKLF